MGWIRTRGVEFPGRVFTASEEGGKGERGPKEQKSGLAWQGQILRAVFLSPEQDKLEVDETEGASLDISKRPGVLVEDFPSLWCGTESHKDHLYNDGELSEDILPSLA